MKTIFIVDDNDVNLLMAEETLSKQYNVCTLKSAASMFELLNNIVPDLIMLDILMPKTSGFDAIKLLKADVRYASIPIIFLTGKADADTESYGFELGAVDFISKPFNERVLLKRVQTHLDIDELIIEKTTMLQLQIEKLQKLKNSMVSVLSDMLESRDKETGSHTERTTAYLRMIINAMIKKGIYSGEMSGWDLDVAISSARLHDVGKIAISDLILNKPDALTKEEFETMKNHAAEGIRIIDKVISMAGDEDFLEHAKLFAGYHHERWDGSGYPHGLRGEDIPLQGRIMAIVDVYDALTSNRPYKSALSHKEAVKIIIESKGSHFDPKITGVFYDINDSFEQENGS
ncbi:MAG: response regulator [Oscillospiraceae bacterium]|nr:response regulator [Oscillospiraceae bacterium]